MDAIQVLTELGADLNATNKWGQTACMEAAYFGKTATLKALAELGADISIKDKEGKTVLDMIKDARIKKEIVEAAKRYNLKHARSKEISKRGLHAPKQKISNASKSQKKHRPAKTLHLERKMQILNEDKTVIDLRHKREHILEKELEGIQSEQHRLAVRRRTDVQDLRNKEDIARSLKLKELYKQRYR